MLKLASNAMGHLGSFVDDEGHLVQWKYVEELQKLQAQEGLTLGNKLSSNYLKFEKHKMNVRLAAQTLSSSVANATAFMDQYDSTHSLRFSGSAGTVKWIKYNIKIFTSGWMFKGCLHVIVSATEITAKDFKCFKINCCAICCDRPYP